LNRYQVLDDKREVLIDYSKDIKRKLVIKTKDLEIAELIEI
jgi:hypothetical protein